MIQWLKKLFKSKQKLEIYEGPDRPKWVIDKSGFYLYPCRTYKPGEKPKQIHIDLNMLTYNVPDDIIFVGDKEYHRK